MINVAFTQSNLEYYLLILTRIASFIFIAPFFGQANTPQRIKIGLAIFVSYLIYTTIPVQTPEYGTIIEYASLVVKESIAGLLIGFSAFICNTIILFAGNLIDMEIGLSMVSLFDPTTKTQTTITGSMYSYFILMLMIATDMHLFLLNALVDSFQVIPIGGMKIGSGIFDTVVGFLTNYFIIGFRIILPVFSVMLILNCILGILAKVAPQMNMFVVGMQLKILLGFGVMFLTVQLLPGMANFIFEQMRDMVVSVMRGMQ